MRSLNMAKLRRSGLATFLVVACGLVVATHAHAQSGTWLNTGTTSSLWSTTSNWVGGTVPGVTSGTTVTGTTVFNSAVGTYGTSGSPITIDSGRTLNVLEFQANSGGYTIGTLAGGTLSFGAGGWIVSGNTATNAPITINAPLRMLGNLDLVQNATGTYSIGGPITATATGTLTLRGDSGSTNNFLTGNITSSTGTLRLATSGSTSWTLSGTSTFGAGMAIASNSGYSITNTGSMNLATSTLLVTSGSFVNNNRLSWGGGGAIQVNGSNAAFVNAGTVSAGSAGITIRGFGSIINTGTMSGSTLNVGASGGSGDVNSATAVTFTNAAGASATINSGGGFAATVGREYYGAITNAGYLRLVGVQIGRGFAQGTGVTLAGTSSITITSGTIDSSSGLLRLRAENANTSNVTAEINLNGGLWTTDTPAISVSTFGNTTGTNNRFFVNFNSGTFRTTNSVGTTIMPSTLTAVTLNAGGGTLDIGTLSSGANAIAATIIGTGGLTKAGAGTLSLSGSNTFAGPTRVVAGSLSIDNANALQNSTLDLATADTGTISAIGQDSTLGGLAGSRNLDMLTRTLSIGNNNASTTYSGNLANGALTKIGSGVLSLTGSNTFTGLATVSAGTLEFNTINALRNASGVNIADAAGLRYSGSAATFDRNISVTSGTGTVANTGGGLLTLAGTLTKNGTVLRLTGGQFNVTGQIVGANANSDLLVDGTSTVTLSSANTYNGPTFVNQASTLILGVNNAIPGNSIVTLGNATSAGTLNMNGFPSAIGGLAFGAGGGTLRLAATSTSAAPLTASAGTVTLTNGTLDLTGSGTSAGLYRLISAQTVSGSLASVTGASAAYQVITSATSVDYQQRAVLGTVSVSNPAAIITGGTQTFTYSVNNTALAGGANLVFTAAGLSNVIGSSSGTAAAGGSSGALPGFAFTSSTVGNNQQGTFTVDAPSAFGSTTATGTVSVTVLDHATSSLGASLLTSSTISLGTYNYATQTWESGGDSALFSIFNIASAAGASLTADLSLLGVTGAADGFTTNVPGTYTDIAGGGSQQFSIFFDPTGATTNRSTTFAIAMSDKTSLAGATPSNTLYVTASVIVVPEPGAIALAGIGAALAGWIALRRRK